MLGIVLCCSLMLSYDTEVHIHACVVVCMYVYTCMYMYDVSTEINLEERKTPDTKRHIYPPHLRSVTET